ncbi:cytochrome P450 [Kitasatospora purpeofusca]|uniref:cytochrome P450 n=1 Tax=Kitasatospora purpeofusca TaxID=67352 RepID=UPI0036AB6C6C
MEAGKPIPLAPKARPLVGHAVRLLRDPLAFLTGLPEYGDLVRVRIGPFTMHVVCGAELTHQVLLDDKTFDKGGPIFARVREVTGNGLASCLHDDHRKQRRLVQPAFRPERVVDYTHTMTAIADAATGAWQEGQVLDVPAEMMRITTATLAATAFSDAFHRSVHDQLITDIGTVVGGLYKRVFMPAPLDRIPTRGNRAYGTASARIRTVLEQAVSDRRTSPTAEDNLLSRLLAARDSESGGAGMSDREIVDSLVTFFIAGVETTAHALAWALYLLTQNPEVERRLHSEVDAVLSGGPATHADLGRLGFAGHVITETLRFCGPIWLLTRTVTKDTRLGDYELRAGSTVLYSPYIVHHRKEHFEDPFSFDPDRWDASRARSPRGAVIPFGAGARKCIGDNYAMAQAVLTLATVARRWRLRPLSSNDTRPALALTLRPRELLMRATSRGCAD